MQAIRIPLALAFLSVTAQVFAQGEAPAAPGRATTVEEIVVTARKRAERLIDTPVSVTALSQDSLVQSSVQQIDAIAALVPNVRFSTELTGNNASIRIRGIGTAAVSPAFDPGVGLYVDGVFLSRAQASVLDVLDFAQIEVLRGPQGTLFGKNTVGGAVSITTQKPSDEIEASVRIRAGNLNAVETRAMVNLPVSIPGFEDRLAVRAAVASRNRDGYVRHVQGGQDLSDTNSLSFLGSIRFDPTDAIGTTLTGTWSRSHTGGRGAECIIVNPEGPLLGALPGYPEACAETRPFRTTADADGLADFSNYGLWGTIEVDLGELAPALDGLTLKNIAAWREQRSRVRQDLDLTDQDVLTLSSAGGVNPLDGTPGEYQQITEEIQVAGSLLDDRLNFVGGFFGFWEEARQGNVTRVPLTNNRSENLIVTDNFTWALFGQATLDVTEWLSLTGGIRYSSDRKDLQFFPHPADEPIDPSQGGTGRETFTAWTPMGSVALTTPPDWLDGTPIDHLMTYFTYSQGFKGGGFNGIIGAGAGPLTSFGPETLDSFEVGLKTVALDQRLTASLSFFYGLYDDIQVVQLIVEEDEEGEVAVSRPTLNAAKAKTRGIELEFRYIPIEGLVLSGNFGWIRGRYDRFRGISDLDGEEVDRSGQPFPMVPELSGFLSAQYSIPIDLGHESLDGYLTPRLEWSYQGSIITVGPEVPEGRQPHVNLVNGRLSYDFLDDRAQIALWALNLTDERYMSNALSLAGFFGNLNRYYAPPRTYGVEVSWRF